MQKCQYSFYAKQEQRNIAQLAQLSMFVNKTIYHIVKTYMVRS